MCGAVRFKAEEVETEFAACHCVMCQRWAGSLLLTTSVGKLSVEGEEHLKCYRSSDWAERGFCGVCGSNLFYRILKLERYEICVGAFDKKDDLVMTSEIFIDRKPDGYAFSGDHPRLTEVETLAKYPDWAES